MNQPQQLLCGFLGIVLVALAGLAADQPADSGAAHPFKTVSRLEHQRPIRAAAYAPDGKTLVTAGDEKHLSVWDLATGKRIVKLEQHERPVSGLAWTADGKMLASVGDHEAWIWDMEKRRAVQRIEGGGKRAAWSVDGKRLAIGGWNELAVYDPRTGRKSQVLDVEPQPDTGLVDRQLAFAFSDDGAKVAAVSFLGHLRTFDVTNGRLLREEKGKPSALWFVARTADGATVAPYPAGGIGWWNLKAARLERYVPCPAAFSLVMALSPDERNLAVAGDGAEGKTIEVWETATGKRRGVLTGHTARVHTLIFSTGGQLASGGDDGAVLLWETGKGDANAQLSSEEHGRLWRALGDDNAAAAFAIVQRLRHSPAAVPLLTADLARLPARSIAEVEALAKQLDHADFTQRNQAFTELQALGSLAKPTLQNLLPKLGGGEVRERLEQLLAQPDGPATTPERRQAVRSSWLEPPRRVPPSSAWRSGPSAGSAARHDQRSGDCDSLPILWQPSRRMLSNANLRLKSAHRPAPAAFAFYTGRAGAFVVTYCSSSEPPAVGGRLLDLQG